MIMASNVRKGLVIVAGAVVIAGGVSVVQIWRSWIRRRSRKLEHVERRIEDGIGLDELAVLTKSPNVSLRRSAEQLLLDKITQSNSFRFVLLSCQSQDEEQVLKACTVLCVILKSVDYRSCGMDRVLIPTLVNCLIRSMDRNNFTKTCSDVSFPEKIQRMTLAATFDFVCDADEKKDIVLTQTDCVVAMLKLVQDTRSKEVLRFALFLLHQMAMYDAARAHLINSDAISVFASLSVSHHGDNILQKLCFQVIVILVNTPGIRNEGYLHEVARQRVLIRAAVSCKADDAELAYWAVALLHEFAIQTNVKDHLYTMPFLLGNLQKSLVSNVSALQRLILRIISFMCLHHDEFKVQVANNTELMQHIPICLSSGEPEVVHWAMVLLYDLAESGQDIAGKSFIDKLLGSSDDAIIKAMSALSRNPDHMLVRLMAETLGFFCSCEQLHPRLVAGGVLTVILDLAMSNDSDLAFWAAALLLNLAMTSDAVKHAILKAGGLHGLVELALGDYEDRQVTAIAAKTLVMLGYTENPLKVHLHLDAESGIVKLHDTNYNMDNPGITVMIWDTQISAELVCQNYNKEAQEDINPESTLDIQCLKANHNIGNLVFITIKGKHSTAYLQGFKDILHFKETCSFSGIQDLKPCELPSNHMCAIVARLTAPERLDVWHIVKSDRAIDLQLQFNYGEIVNDRVEELILSPLLKRLDSVPAHSPISRVTDLELLEILARHDRHLPTLKKFHNLVDILTDMLWYCTAKGLESLESEPLALAHCLGALQVLAVLTIHDFYQSALLSKRDTVSAITSILFNIVSILLASVMGNDESSSRRTPRNRMEPPTTEAVRNLKASSGSRGTTRIDSASDELDGDSNDGDVTADSLYQQALEERISSLGSMAQQFAQNATSQEAIDTPESFTVVDNPMAAEFDNENQTDDRHRMYRRVAKYAALVLSNLASQQDKDTLNSAQFMLNHLGATHVLWASLLCSTEVFKYIISFPVSLTLSRLIASDYPLLSSGSVVLDVADKTPSMIISSDLLEVRNYSWTFESIRTNVSLPRTCDESTAGWYYEVLLLTNGIIQIGWANKQCRYRPEKGYGVGDCTNSCAYDGSRCKVWMGPITEALNNDYGSEWGSFTVVSCLMDRYGNASYWLQGKDMGVAFKGIDLTQGWYPACSVSTDQQLRFNFGDTPFRYANQIPAGFIPFSQISAQRNVTENRNNNADIPDIPIAGVEDHKYNDDLGNLSYESKHSVDESFDPDQSLSPPVGFNRPIVIDDSTDEVCPVLSPDDDSSMAEFGYSGIQGEECADERSAIMDEANTDELFGEGGEEALQSEHPLGSDAVYRPIGAAGEASCDDNQPISRHLFLSAAAEGENPVPSLYFEVAVTHCTKRPLVFGYCTIDGLDQVCAAKINTNNQIVLPDQTLTQIPIEASRVTIGCALLSPPGAVFFTVDGEPIRHLLSFREEEAGLMPLMPCTNNPYIRINFGQDEFEYEPANQLEHRLAMGALLYDYHQSRMVMSTRDK